MMKGQKGITLVALIITIIVMLILVGVSITVAINGGLFDRAREGRDLTNKAATEEKNLADGTITIQQGGENIVTSINNVVDGTVQ